MPTKRIITTYPKLLSDLKEKIRQARQRASLSVNAHLLSLYWEIGHAILQQQDQKGWGSKVIDRLASDLKGDFPDMKGFSVRNLKYMRAFAGAHPNFMQLSAPQNPTIKKQKNGIVQAHPAQMGADALIPIVQGALAQLSWYHHITLLDKVKQPEIRLFYIRKTAEQGWSRDMMVHQIEGKLHEREGALSNNFIRTIPDYESDLTRQLFKDPYQFDFIMLGEAAKERDLEEALMNQITKFLLELGDGFAFMGRQKRFETGGKEFYVDLLFYHTKLRRHIIIDLKIREFEPEFVSKMNVYLGLADDQIKGHQDGPSIGIILCKTKNKIIAEYALRDTSKPIGIAEYKIAQQLPPDIKGELPSIEELERELEEEVIKMQKPIEKKMQRIKDLANALRTEEVKEKNTKENGLKIFNKVFLPLKKLLMTKLSEEISSWFEDTQVSMQIANRGFKTDTESRNEIKKLTYCPHEMKLSINLRGFKKAGAKAFSSWRDFVIRLSEYNYIITIANLQGYSLEKLYHKVLSKVEQTEVVEKFCEAVADDITAQLERLQKEKR